MRARQATGIEGPSQQTGGITFLTLSTGYGSRERNIPMKRRTVEQPKACAWNSKGIFFVRSTSDPSLWHRIGHDECGHLTCDCKAFEFSEHPSWGKHCKHIEHAAAQLEKPMLRPRAGTAQYRFYMATYDDPRRRLARMERDAAWITGRTQAREATLGTIDLIA